MTATGEEPMSKKVATLHVAAVYIYCPVCSKEEDPIPAPDGSFLWGTLPETVRCWRCKNVFRVGKRVRMFDPET